MKKKKSMIILLTIVGISVATFSGYTYLNQINVISDFIIAELGDELNQEVSYYASGNINNMYFDSSKVDTNKISTYTAYLVSKDKKIPITVNVTDTTPPTADVISDLSFLTYTEVNANQLVENIFDESKVIATFLNGEVTKVYTDGGEYNEQLILTDEGNNTSILEAVISIIPDTEKPVIRGVKNKTLYVNESIDYLLGISATDDRDGDLTDELIVDDSNVNLSKEGVYIVMFNVTDVSGNTAKKKMKITVKKDIAPVISGTKDKTIFLNESVDFLSGVSATDDRDGNITDKLIVDKSKVNTSKAGKYPVTYKITDSSGNKTELTVSLTIKVKNTPSTTNAKTSDKTITSTKNENTSSNNSSNGFQFFDVEPSGTFTNGDVEPNGVHVGNW